MERPSIKLKLSECWTGQNAFMLHMKVFVKCFLVRLDVSVERIFSYYLSVPDTNPTGGP